MNDEAMELIEELLSYYGQNIPINKVYVGHLTMEREELVKEGIKHDGMYGELSFNATNNPDEKPFLLGLMETSHNNITYVDILNKTLIENVSWSNEYCKFGVLVHHTEPLSKYTSEETMTLEQLAELNAEINGKNVKKK